MSEQPYEATDWAAWQAEFITRFKQGRGRPPRAAASTGGELAAALRAEWDAEPLAPLGRALLSEIDAYLEYLEIVRSTKPGP